MSAGPETDAATCHDCTWNCSGPWSHDAAAQHKQDTGHRPALYAVPKPSEPPLYVTNKGTREIWRDTGGNDKRGSDDEAGEGA